MTRKEIPNTPAGREMDALIAEKIFGWSWNGDFLLPPSDHPASVNHWCAEWDDEGRPHWLPNYSTDIADAWTVVEKMNSIKMDTDEGYQIRAKFLFGIQMLHGKEEKEASLAICRAALLAVMEAE